MRTRKKPARNMTPELLLAMPAPKGMTKKVADHTIVFEGDGVTIEILINPNAGKETWDSIQADGSTKFTTSKGTRTFDRTGVSASFYIDLEDTVEDVQVELMGQLDRVKEARERLDRSETVPGLPGGWMVTPEKKAQQAADLKAGKAITFTPAGFGTGYRITRRKQPYGCTTLPASFNEFYGLTGQWYAEHMDCD